MAAGFSLVIDEFTAARAAYVMGRETVAASDPLTVEAYSSGVDSVGDGARNLALAASLVQQIELPPTYTAASAVAPSCR